MVNIFNIKILESIYAIYMYNFFKTRWYIHHPLEYYLMNISIYDFLRHPIDSSTYDSKICPFGNLVGFIFGIWIILRSYLNNKNLLKINKILVYLIFFGSLLLNMNAFIYYIPIFIYEFNYY